VVGACHVVGVWAGEDMGPVGRCDGVGGAVVVAGRDSVGELVGAGAVVAG
jgi:hypothetical protein